MNHHNNIGRFDYGTYIKNDEKNSNFVGKHICHSECLQWNI